MGHPQHKRAGVIDPKRRVNFVGEGGALGLDGAIGRLLNVVSPKQILVLKTHSAPTKLVHKLAREGRVMCQAIFRDPRDNVLSLVDAGVRARAEGRRAFSRISSLDDAVIACEKAFEDYEKWCEVSGVLIASYEQVAYSSEDFLRRVHSQLESSDASVDFGAVCKRVKCDRFTQFNKGVSRRHRADLSIDACIKLTARFADLIERHMGAELDELDRSLISHARCVEIPDSFVGLYNSDPRMVSSRFQSGRRSLWQRLLALARAAASKSRVGRVRQK